MESALFLPSDFVICCFSSLIITSRAQYFPSHNHHTTSSISRAQYFPSHKRQLHCVWCLALFHIHLSLFLSHQFVQEFNKLIQCFIRLAPQPTCNSDSILAGHSLKGGTRSGRFTALGETASIHACLQRCCSKQTCDVALLIDGRCYGVACFSKELCKAVPVPHPHFIFSQLGFLNKGQKREKIQRNHGKLKWYQPVA